MEQTRKILALCDIVPEKAEHAQSLVVKSGQKAPELYTKGDHAFESLVARDDLDLVIIATPWNWHVEMAVASMTHGKHTCVEVPAATTIKDCWKLVNTSEQTRRHCIMLENCCYGYNETLVLRMVHAGLFGDLLYGEGAYIHDLRDELFSNKGEGLWRRIVHTQRDGNLYPTHGLGPVANYMGIQRGDRFDYLVSMSTPQHGLEEYRKQHIAAVRSALDRALHQRRHEYLASSKPQRASPSPLSTTPSTHTPTTASTSSPAPRALSPTIRRASTSTDRPAAKSGARIDNCEDKYQHPLWKKEGDIAQKLGGHGGMDYIMLYRLLQCMRQGLIPDMDVYDAAELVRARPVEHDLSRQRQRARQIPRLHPRKMAGALRVSNCNTKLTPNAG